MIREHIEQRVLGAIQFVDGTTGSKITRHISLNSPNLTFFRNKSGCHVIKTALSLETHENSFWQPPTEPPIGSLATQIETDDPLGEYLPRRFAFQLPRDPSSDPQSVAQPASLFRPIQVPLFPSPTAVVSPGWATIRATVVEEGTARTIPGALIRILRTSDSNIIARGLSDSRGEMLIRVPGIPVTTWEEGAGTVLTNEVEIIVNVIVDPLGSPIPDPDDLETRREELPQGEFILNLSSGVLNPTRIFSVPLQ